MTALDQFTHEIFVNGGADIAHAMPTVAKHAAMLPVLPVANVAKNALEVANGTALELLQDAVKDTFVALTTGVMWAQGAAPFATIPVVVVLVLVIQVSVRKVRKAGK
jgi:hypothetical protein